MTNEQVLLIKKGLIIKNITKQNKIKHTITQLKISQQQKRKKRHSKIINSIS